MFINRLLAIVVCMFPLAAFAVPAVPEQAGWSGFAGFGVGYTDIKSNTVAGNRLVDGGDPTITSVTQRPEWSDTTHALITGEITYSFGNSHAVFAGTTLEDAVTFDSAIQIGWRKQAETAGTFQLGFLLNALVPSEVWADPYAENVVREDVDRDSYGLRFQWDKIFAMPLEFTFTYRDIEVGKESSGATACAAALPTAAACQALLVRDGDYYETRLSWLFKLKGGHVLRPVAGYRVMDAQGDSVSYDSPYVQLTYSYLGGKKFTFVSNASYGQQSFDAANPIPDYSGAKQDSKNFVVDATLFYKLPVDSNRWQLFGMASYGSFDSDIDFHDNGMYMVGTGLMYRFGSGPMVKKPQ